MEDEKLIELVRKNVVLYDLSQAKYMDPKYKMSVWNKIGAQLNTTGNQCKSRWTNVRDHFRRHLGKRQIKNGQVAQNTKKYKYEDMLQFILPHINSRQFISNIKSPEAEEEEEELTFNQEESITNDKKEIEAETIEPITTDAAPQQSSAERENTRKRTSSLQSRSSSAKKKLPAIDSPSSLLMKYIIDKNKIADENIQHPVDAFLVGIGATIKKFSPYSQHLAKGRIFSVVQELELQELQNHYAYSPENESSTSQLDPLIVTPSPASSPSQLDPDRDSIPSISTRE